MGTFDWLKNIRRAMKTLPELTHKETKLCWAQEGEDMILKCLFPAKTTGFFVDIGAHHPRRFSNTYWFYKLGWRGINVDAMPGSMAMFRTIRPGDVNLEAAVAEKKGSLTYYIFNDGALNTFDEKMAKEANEAGGRFKIIREVPVPTVRLDEILDKYTGKDRVIDFMSIDVEGLELQVLKSNDWLKYRPRILLVECHRFNLQSLGENQIWQFLSDKGYSLLAKTISTLVFSSIDYLSDIEDILYK
jgi:FkbM family methyltransferase